MFFNDVSEKERIVEMIAEILKVFSRLKCYLDRLSRTEGNMRLCKMGAEMVNKILEWKIFLEEKDKILLLLS
jgi:hypothetical protein